MIVVMNVVTVAEENRAAFEERFQTRERLLDQAEGFAGFELLERDVDGGGEYSVLTRWESREAFQSWVKSDLFARAHKRDREEGSVAATNELRTYEVIDAQVPA